MAYREKTEYIVIHCAATRPSQNIGAHDIDKWHRERGFSSIGYNYVICRDGTLEEGRAKGEVGAHAKGYNSVSVGICLVGGVSEEDFRVAENNFTGKQFAVLESILRFLKLDYPNAKIVGHNELDPKKACPSFNVQKWLAERKIKNDTQIA